MSWFFPRDGEWKTLEQALQAHTRDELDMLGAALGLPKLQGRKDERIARLIGGMTGESLRQAWSRLSELQQAAVAQAVHSPDAGFSPQGFKIRFGEEPDGAGSLILGAAGRRLLEPWRSARRAGGSRSTRSGTTSARPVTTSRSPRRRGSSPLKVCLSRFRWTSSASRTGG